MSASSYFDAAPFLKDIGRGRDHPSDLDIDRADALFAALLEGRLDARAQGAVLIAMRMKGETATEVAGFLRAAGRFGMRLGTALIEPWPVVIPSYNGARKLVNLTPLLAFLLARSGVPVLLHGPARAYDLPPGRAMRVTSGEIMAAMGHAPRQDQDSVVQAFAARVPAFVAIERLHAPLAEVLGLRRILGVRSSAHTVVKLLQPFDGQALALSSFTHPHYQRLLEELFVLPVMAAQGDQLMLRASEGEPVQNARRATPMQHVHAGAWRALESALAGSMHTPHGLPDGFDVASTVHYIEAVLADRLPVPAPIAWQVEIIGRIRAERLGAATARAP